MPSQDNSFIQKIKQEIIMEQLKYIEFIDQNQFLSSLSVFLNLQAVLLFRTCINQSFQLIFYYNMIIITAFFSTVLTLLPSDGEYVISRNCTPTSVCCLAPDLSFPGYSGYYVGKGNCNDDLSKWIKTTDSTGVTLKNKQYPNFVMGAVGGRRKSIVATTAGQLDYTKINILEVDGMFRIEFTQSPGSYVTLTEYYPLSYFTSYHYKENQFNFRKTN